MWIYSISKFEKQKNITSDYVICKINMWNKYYLNYKKYIKNGKAYLIKYETFLQRPTEILDEIGKKYKLTKKGVYTFESKKLLPNSDYNKGKTSTVLFDDTIYKNINISKYLTKDIIKTINDTIDITLMDFYEYKIEEN